MKPAFELAQSDTREPEVLSRNENNLVINRGEDKGGNGGLKQKGI